MLRVIHAPVDSRERDYSCVIISLADNREYEYDTEIYGLENFVSLASSLAARVKFG